MPEKKPEILIDGLHFPEGPRWRTSAGSETGLLWFSDILAGNVMHVDMSGNLTRVVGVPNMPSGLGWLPDGTLVIVSVTDGRLLAHRDDRLVEIADMRAATGLPCNDMVAAADGTAYIGAPGPGLDESKVPGPGNMPAFGYVVSVAPGGRAAIAADRMTFPNGALITPDGRTLIFAETFGFRLTAFDIAADGSLANRRVWADLGVPPDGICLDEEGCVWVAAPYYRHGGPGGYIRVAEGGEVRERIDVDGYSSYACTLGGPQMRTLFLLESAVFGLPRHPGDGRIRTIEVDVPGTGSP